MSTVTLNASDLSAIKQKILSDIEHLKEEIMALERLSEPVAPDSAIGRLSRMEAINAKSINDAALRSAKNKLLSLKSALTRIESDEEFGLCEECLSPIPLQRLMLLPESLYCVTCADKTS